MAIAVDATSEVFSTSADPTTTLSHTVAGSDRVLIVVVHTNGGTVSGVDYNGVPMTLAISQQNDVNAIWDYIYYLSDPDTGTHNIEVTHTNGCDRAIGGISFTGANPSDPIGGTNSADDSSAGQTSFNTTVTTDGQDGFIVDVMRSNNPLTVDGSQTRFMTQDSFNGNRSAGASYESFSGGANPSMDWTMTSTNLNTIAAVEVKEFVATLPTKPLILMQAVHRASRY